MPSAKTLNVSIIGETKKFDRAITRAISQVKKFAGSVAAFAAGDILASGLKSAASALIDYTKASFETIDKSAKLADTLGTTVQSLMSLQSVGNMAGTSVEGINAALGKMTINIGEALNGNENLQQAFESLGLSAEDMAKNDAVENFKAIGKALQALPTAAQKAEMAVAIFGKSALELMPTLLSDIQAGQDEFDALAGSISRIDAAAVEQANDSVTKLQIGAEGLGRQIAVALSPYISQAANDLIGMGVKGTAANGAIADSIKWIIDALKTVVTVSQYVYQVWQGFKLVLQYIEFGVLKMIGFFYDGTIKIINLWGKLYQLIFAGIEKVTGMKPPKWLTDIADGAATMKGSKYWERYADLSGKAIDQTHDKMWNMKQDIDGEISTRGIDNWVKKAQDSAKKVGEEMEAQRKKAAEIAKVTSIIAKKKDGPASEEDKAIDKLIEMAAKFKEAIKTPLEKFAETVNKLKALKNLGLMSPEEVAKAAAEELEKAKNDLKKDDKDKKIGDAKQINFFTNTNFGSGGKAIKTESEDEKKMVILLKKLVEKDTPLKA